ncbi:MAG: hypothetical protein H8E55_70355 [Pelagibacterales bacterium]|jgi:hypothetical protein|nr:hypothetical protein [Pelagibacterales bacterium]|tara:strand:+ start:124 stop:390 length:267 start_codon:yes stop_codon:yes gene_type:complete
METLNKNWFAITLIAVIFFLLGFLIGRNIGPKPQMHKVMVKKNMAHQMDVSKGFEWVSDENNNVIIDIDTTDGHKNIKVEVRKIHTEE